jgi:uncharacterized glyoxalase superfamily protein PhnB
MSSKESSTISAPAMRFVPVSNLQTSLSFYSDQLGFVQTELQRDYGVGAVVEMFLGPAHIQLCPVGVDKGIEREILFFEVQNVAHFREELLKRGAKPGKLEKVNWIKMEMFEVRDPDGNVLWFGASFHQPDQEGPRPMVEQFLPHLPFDDVAAAVRYYCDIFGFKINYSQEDLGVMYRDTATLLLIQRSEAHKGIGSCSAYINDADKLYAELLDRGASVVAPPVSRPWGLRDFTVIDLEGNRITFAQPFE